MGTSTSKASPLAPTFERMSTWDLKASRALLQTYKDKDMDFGLDSQGLADLVGGDKDWAEGIIDAFRSPTGIINALAFVCGACLVSSGPALEKAGMIFDALDFDGTEQISMDEMTIAFLCCARGFCVMAGVGTVPSDEELESVTLQAYRDLNKGSTQSISKTEFTKWILEFANGTGVPPTREVTLQNAFEQFRVVPPTKIVDEKESNNTISQEGDDSNKLHVDEAPQQKADENDAEFVPDQEHEHIEKASEFSEPIEPQFVVTDVNQHALSENIDASEYGTVQAEAEDSALIDDNDQGKEQSQTHEIVDQVDEVHVEVNSGDEPEQQVANESHESGIEVVDDHGVTGDTESDFPTFVADEPPLANYEQANCTSTDEQTNELNTDSQRTEIIDVDLQGDVNNNRKIETEVTEPVAASEKMETENSPPEPISTAELETDDLEYEQEEFVQETPRPNDVVEDSSSGENADIQPLENTERDIQPPIEPAVEMADPATDTDVHEVISAQQVAEYGANVDEISASVATPDQEPISDNAEADEEAALGDAVTATAVPAVDTDFNAFDNQDLRFGREPQERNDDTVVTAVDLGDANASHHET